MANKNLLTYAGKVAEVEHVYYSPVATLPAPINQVIGTTYCFLSKVDPWPDENNPPVPQQTQRYLKNVYKNMFVAKRILANNISPIAERIDWTTGTVYDYYRDDIDMFEKDENDKLVLKFYVKNRYDQVFKCLWNNNGASSVNEPFFQPGSYGTNNIFTGADGYKWKYIYTIDIGSKQNFMDANYMPAPVGEYTPNGLQTNPTSKIKCGYGNIDVINILDGGSGYDPTSNVVSVVITGDGSGATAIAEVTAGAVTNIIVTNPGINYTYATATIVSASGSGAVLYSPVSPIGGHGFDDVSELGCSRVMFVCEFNGSEGGLLPTDIDYHQFGLLVNPVALSTYVEETDTANPAEGTVYKTTTDFIVSSGFGVYTLDEFVFQVPAGSPVDISNASFIGTVLSFNTSTNIINLINTTGTFTTNAPVYGNTSKTTRTLLSVSLPDFQVLSGYLTYIENRAGIQRSADGTEQIKIVLQY